MVSGDLKYSALDLNAQIQLIDEHHNTFFKSKGTEMCNSFSELLTHKLGLRAHVVFFYIYNYFQISCAMWKLRCVL